MIAELDDGGRQKHALGVHDEATVLEHVEVRSDEEEVGAALDGEEARSGHVDASGVAEVLDGGSDGRLELDNGLAVVRDLVVDDNLEVHAVVVHDALDGTEVDPEVT